MENIKRIFDLQYAHFLEEGNASVKHRLAKLTRLEKSLMKYRYEIKHALYSDHKKTGYEVDLLDLLPVLKEIRFAKKNIHKWTAPKKVPTPLLLLGSSSYVYQESKGVVLIISPWNFPINLSFSPLISAIAAGNCVIIKPAENTVNASAIIKKIVDECFDEKEVAVIEGGVETAKALLKLPFHHIFFTGSPAVGKIVMKNAAENLTSVTLELGGKSPTIVDQTANLKETAKRLLLVKYLINGQICIAPDYVLVHSSVAKAFAEELKKVIVKFIGNNPKTSETYSRIVDARQHKRMIALLEDALENGDEIIEGGTYDETDNYVAPTIIISKNENSKIMTEEVFGPILPLKTYENDDEILTFIHSQKRSLALYIFSTNKKRINTIIKNTRSGATVINAAGLHHYNGHLPFGGVNNSGIGKSHGYWGFQEFSNPRAILKTNFIFNNVTFLMPPYNALKKWIIDFAVKYL